MSDAATDKTVDEEEEIIVKLTDYFDGTLPAAERAEVEKKIASEAAWKRTHDEMVEMAEAKKMISGMRKAKPPEPDKFVEDVTGTIHKRSGGAFFGRRTLGDRVPFGVLLVVALVALAVIFFLMQSSSTGSLKVDPKAPPAPTKPMPTP
jgi:anti-sigma factor RsiW